MARNTYRTRLFHCQTPTCRAQFRAGFWSRKTMDIIEGQFSTLGDVRCPECNGWQLERESEASYRRTYVQALRPDHRPVVFRWHDDHGREHYRYPSATTVEAYAQDRHLLGESPAEIATKMSDWRYNGTIPRPGEERVEFSTLREAERFCKEQHPNYRDWTEPLNDIFDYSNPDTALSDSDPEGEAELAEIAAQDNDDWGTMDAPSEPAAYQFSVNPVTESVSVEKSGSATE